MSVKKLEEIVTNIPIYGVFSFSLVDVDNVKAPFPLSAEAKEQFHELFFNNKIDIKCVECNKEYPFDVVHVIKKNIYRSDIYKFIGLLSNEIDCKLDE